MKKGWEVDDYCKFIKMQLGGSALELSIENDLPFIVEKIAFEELKNYMHTIQTMTCGFAPIINLEGKNVENIKYVLRNQNYSMPFGVDSNMFIYQNALQSGMIMNSWAKDRIIYNAQMAQIKNTLSTDMDYNYDKVNEKLYLYCQPPSPSVITIAYTPDYQDVNEVYNPYWITYLKRFALAYAKEQEGRIRSKYTLNSATYALDGNQLLSEAQSELSQIRAELDANVNIMHTIS